jgi:hypothetical protein
MKIDQQRTRGLAFAGAIEARRYGTKVAGNRKLESCRDRRLGRQQSQALALIGDAQFGGRQVGGQVAGALNGQRGLRVQGHGATLRDGLGVC